MTLTLDDTVFNWLQMKVVADHRLDDQPAQETFQFFTDILQEEFKLSDIEVDKEDPMYIIRYVYEQEQKEQKVPIEFAHQLLYDIESEPKYNE